jgi:hypothetical protein
MSPPLFGPCKKPWDKKARNAAPDQDGVTLLPLMPKGVKKKLWRRRRKKRGQKATMMKLRMKHMSSPLSLLVAMERGQLRKNPDTSPIPKRAIKPPISTKAAQLLEFLLNISKE